MISAVKIATAVDIQETVYRNGVVVGDSWNRSDKGTHEIERGVWKNKRAFRTSTINRHNHYIVSPIALVANSPFPIRPSSHTTPGRSAELTKQGRGHSTTDDSSTLPSHQEESEGCELLFHLSSCSVISFARTTLPPLRMILKSRIVQSESKDNVESYHLN